MLGLPPALVCFFSQGKERERGKKVGPCGCVMGLTLFVPSRPVADQKRRRRPAGDESVAPSPCCVCCPTQRRVQFRQEMGCHWLIVSGPLQAHAHLPTQASKATASVVHRAGYLQRPSNAGSTEYYTEMRQHLFCSIFTERIAFFFLVTQGGRSGKNAATAMGYGQEQGVAVPMKPNPSTRKAKAWRKMYR